MVQFHNKFILWNSIDKFVRERNDKGSYMSLIKSIIYKFSSIREVRFDLETS